MAGGILILDKPAGWTSHDAVAKLRGILKERRIGHGGTRDPMATGVLPVFVGRATRAVELFEAADKTYVAGLRLGLVTNTEDSTGEVLETRPVSVTQAQLQQALDALVGEQLQVPPMYSAIKIGGKKLYELARAGKEAERPARKITIFETALLDFTGEHATFRVRCSKGTYVRSICRDLGEQLGCGGCMDSLRRVRAGVYTEADTVTLEQLQQSNDPWALLRPVDTLFADLPAVTVDSAQAARIYNGSPVAMEQPEGRYRVYGPDGEFLMVGSQKDGMLKTVKSFFEVK